MTTPLFLVDAFSHAPFTGNPAAVCLLKSEANAGWMQSVAQEMNQAETAFTWPAGDGYGLRWFTPTVEVDLCGHATLATTHVLSETGMVREGKEVRFHTNSGVLTCTVQGGTIQMDFPAETPSPADLPETAQNTLLASAVWTGQNRMDWFIELPNEDAVIGFEPDFDRIQDMGLRGLIVTAQALRTDVDYVSRFFAPQSGVPEDHVTGSAHCAIGPYWAQKLGRPNLKGYQASSRGGFVQTESREERVLLRGEARTVVQGVLNAKLVESQSADVRPL